MKRSLSILLSLLLLFSLLPVSALADTSDSSEQMEEASGGPTQPPAGVLMLRCNGSTYTETTFPIGNYVVDLFVVHDNGSEYSLLEQHKDTLTTSGAVSMHPKNIETENGTVFVWELTITGNVGAQGFITYTAPDESTSKVIITVAASQPPQGGGEGGESSGSLRGTLMVNCAGQNYWADDAYNGMTLFAGSYPAQLIVWRNVERNDSFVPDPQSITYDGVVEVTTSEANDDQGPAWIVHIRAGGDGIGHITYRWGSGEGEQSTLTVRRIAAGQEVSEEEKRPLTELGSRVTAFTWQDQTYYLGVAEFAENVSGIYPCGDGSRSITEPNGETRAQVRAARVFQLISGTAGEPNARYKLREDVRKEMETAGYHFELTLLPSVMGCDQYPAVVKDVSLCSTGPNGQSDAPWDQFYYTEDSVGAWIYEAQLKKDSTVLESCRCVETYSCSPSDYVSLEDCADVASINTAIKNWLEVNGNKTVDRLHERTVQFRLPTGELTGQIEIPDTNYYVWLLAGENGEWDMSTTIRGGVKLGDAYVVLRNLHFIGAGKDAQVLDDAETPNYAAYGAGQAVYENCVFENYFYAVRTDRFAWGGWNSVFKNNGTAIYLHAADGGNAQMSDNWFVENDTAIRVDATPYVAPLTASRCRFVNNSTDVENNCGKILWMSYNFFYHDKPGSETRWLPILWNEDSGSRALRLNWDQDEWTVCSRNQLEDKILGHGNYHLRGEDGMVIYGELLPIMGGNTPTFAYPLARTEYCNSFFYPNWYGWHRPGWWHGGERYPSYVLWGRKIPDSELNGLYCSSYDGEQVVGSFDFGSSQEGE